MFDNLRDKWRKNRERKERLAAVFDNIKEGSIESVRAALAAVVPDNLDDSNKGWALKLSIDRQDPNVFREVIAYVGNPNHTITYTTSEGRYSTEHSYHPLSYALQVAHTHDIALMLASTPALKAKDKMLESARKGGMQDVAAVIARRIADQRRAEAAQLDRDAVAVDALPPVSVAPPAAVEEGEDIPLAPGESWALMSKTSLAHVTSAEAIGRKLTEIFNFESRERVLITENLKTGAESIGTPESFDRIAPDAVKKAEVMLQRLNAEAAKKSLNL